VEEREEQDDPRALRQTANDPQFVDAGLEFEFFVGPWSSCSQTCGLNDSGYRVSFNFIFFCYFQVYRFSNFSSFPISNRLIIVFLLCSCEPFIAWCE
jgi:hypothetical protein